MNILFFRLLDVVSCCIIFESAWSCRPGAGCQPGAGSCQIGTLSCQAGSSSSQFNINSCNMKQFSRRFRYLRSQCCAYGRNVDLYRKDLFYKTSSLKMAYSRSFLKWQSWKMSTKTSNIFFCIPVKLRKHIKQSSKSPSINLAQLSQNAQKNIYCLHNISFFSPLLLEIDKIFLIKSIK